MRVIPPGAWSGLAVFDPEKLLALQIRSDKADPWDKDYEQLQAEIEQFLSEFKAFAGPLLVKHGRQTLREVCEGESGSRNSDKKPFGTVPDLCQVDLTVTEALRLNKLQTKEIGAMMNHLARAIAALEPARKRRQ